MEENRNISSHLRCEHGLIIHAFTETSKFWAWARGMDALFQEVLANFVKKGKSGMVALCGFTDGPGLNTQLQTKEMSCFKIRWLMVLSKDICG